MKHYEPKWEKTNYKPWGLQQTLKDGRIPTEGDIRTITVNIKDIRTRALFILLYLTAGRITEVCGDLKKRDLTIETRHQRMLLLINMPNRKHKTRHYKEIPIPADNHGLYLKLLNEYLKTKENDDILFPFGKIRAYQLIRAATGFNNHWLRHLRLTHLIINFDFNEFMLMKYAGWTNTSPAKSYTELRWGDFLDKL